MLKHAAAIAITTIIITTTIITIILRTYYASTFSDYNKFVEYNLKSFEGSPYLQL
jgi:hypothetical protein